MCQYLAMGQSVCFFVMLLLSRFATIHRTWLPTAFLENIAKRGVTPGVKRLFVIDGSKALKKAIDSVYRSENPLQRCRNDKVKNVCDHLPLELKDQTKSSMRAAFKMNASP